MSRFDWMEFALCAQTDPDLFHIEEGGSYREAAKICAGCPVSRECITFASTVEGDAAHNSRFGLFGGEAPRARAARKGKPSRSQTHATILRLHDRGGLDTYQIAELADVDPRTVWRVLAANRQQYGEAA